MVKHTSAAFAVLCMAFVVPGSALVFMMPLLMGPNAEDLSGTAPIALALVFFGIVGFKLGNRSPVASPASGRECSESVLSVPPLGSVGTGIIQSEYSNANQRDISIFAELTELDTEAAEMLSRSASQLCFGERSLRDEGTPLSR